jgi:MuDR family transposase
MSTSVHQEPIIEDVGQHESIMTQDLENPKIEVGVAFSDVYCFRKALRQFAILNQFEVDIIKTDKKRFISKCTYYDCPWRIHASLRKDDQSFMVCTSNFQFFMTLTYNFHNSEFRLIPYVFMLCLSNCR